MAVIRFIKIAAFITVSSLLLGNFSHSDSATLDVSIQGSTATINSVPMNFTSFVEGVSNGQEWDSLGAFLVNSNYKTYIIEWTGYGGDVIMMHQFVKKIRLAQMQGKIIILDLKGETNSSHADVACWADKVNFNGFALLYHADAYENGGHKDERVSSDRSEILVDLNECERKGYFNSQDELHMWAGNIMFVTQDGVSFIPDYRKKATATSVLGILL